MRSRHPITLVLIALAALVLPGCPGDDKTRKVNSRFPPTAVVHPVPRQVGNVTVEYVLIDVNADNAYIDVEYSSDGGATFAGATDAGPGAGSEGTSALLTSPDGRDHVFVWDAVADLGGGLHPDILIRIVPYGDTGVGHAGTSLPFHVGNLPPQATVATPSDGSGIILLDFALMDTTSDPCSIDLQYSTDGGGTFAPATISAGTFTSLASAPAPAGVIHAIGWGSLADIGSGIFANVALRLTPSDPYEAGPSVDTAAFRVENTSGLPSAYVDPVPRQDGIIQIDFVLTDIQSDLVDVAFQYSRNSGVTYTPMNLTPGSVTTGLASSPAGTSHSVFWDSIPDVGPGGVSVRVRMTPSDAAGSGTPVETPDFFVGNDPPVITVDAITGTHDEGVIEVGFTLRDTTWDPADVAIWYSADGWLTFFPATIVAGGLQDLPTRPSPGIHYRVAWNTRVDLPNTTTPVELGLTPFDDATGVTEAGVPGFTGTFTVVNLDLPIAYAGSPGPGDIVKEDVTVTYVLIDKGSVPLDIAVEYSLGGPFSAATERSGPPSEGTTGLASSPSGTEHIFVWDSMTDLGPVDSPSVTVRITPPGLAHTTAPFAVNNNEEPFVIVATPQGRQTGDVSVDHTIQDGEGDPVDIAVHFSTDGGVGFAAALDAGAAAGSEGTVGLTSSSTGDPHVFVWDSIGDGVIQGDVTVRIIPADNPDPTLGQGPPALTLRFTVDNTQPPVVNNLAAGGSHGPVTLTYDVYDLETDPVDLEVLYSTDGGASFSPGTLSSTDQGGILGNTILGQSSSSVSPGASHSFVWDCGADIGSANALGVVLRVTPSDSLTGTPRDAAFDILDAIIEADLVLGQDSFSQAARDGRGISSSSGFGSIYFDGLRLFVCDPGNHRVLIFDSLPASDFQTADRVLGQRDFSLGVSNHQGPSASSLNGPRGVFSDGGTLYVADTENHRVLIWNGIPTADNAMADRVLGQPDFGSVQPNGGGGVDADTLDSPSGVYGNGSRLFVADAGNHRVLVWDLPIVANGQPADHVLGQAGMTVGLPNRGGATAANTLDTPVSVHADGTTLLCADSMNHRVLIWDLPIVANGQPADRILGQQDPGSDLANQDPAADACPPELNPPLSMTRRTMFEPRGVASDGTGVCVADALNHRVLVFDRATLVGGDCAAVVLGQPDGITGVGNFGGISDAGLSAPGAVAATGMGLLVLDHGNNRIKVHEPVPAVDMAPAQIVVGQRSFLEGLPLHETIRAGSFGRPGGLDTDGTLLFVSDPDNHRVLGWTTPPTTINKNADLVIGQPDFTSSGSGLSDAMLSAPCAAAYAPGSGRLYVCDRLNNRILGYDAPLSTGQAATIVVGQPDFVTGGPGTTDQNLDGPMGISVGGTTLWVADSGNNRVLRFSAVPPAGAVADLVLGQPDYTTGGVNPAEDLSLDGPADVSVGTRVLVADTGHHRIMAWDTASVVGSPASFVVGQADFTLPATPGTLNGPIGVETGGLSLYVTDAGGHRVVIWDALDPQNGEPADRFIGGGPNAGGISARSLYLPSGMNGSPAVVGAILWVPDGENHRVLRYDTTR